MGEVCTGTWLGYIQMPVVIAVYALCLWLVHRSWGKRCDRLQRKLDLATSLQATGASSGTTDRELSIEEEFGGPL